MGGRLTPVRAALLVVASLTSLQVGAAVAKQLFPEIGALGVVTLRIGLAAMVLLALTRPSLRGRSRRELMTLALFGLVLAGMNLAFYSALARAPLGVVASVELLGPLAIGIATSRRLLDLACCLLAVLGVLLLTGLIGGALSLSAAGLALAALAAVLGACYVMLSRFAGRAAPDAGALALALGIGAAVLVPLGAVVTGPVLLRPDILLVGAAVALLGSALPYSLDVQALRQLSPSSFAVLISLSPAVAAVAGLLLLQEELKISQWAGVASVVLAAVTVAARTRPAALPS